MLSLPDELKNLDAGDAKSAGKNLSSLVSEDTMVGDLLALDYAEAAILVHDALRASVGGLPMGCFLLATRIEANAEVDSALEDSALVLLRVVGRSALPNDAETALHRLDAGFRASDTPETWDNSTKSDQFTLNRLRYAGMRCSVLGTFRMVEEDGKWGLNFGADISNFYSGQGMKVYKPRGVPLRRIVNFTKIQGALHPLTGHPVQIGRLRYSSTEMKVNSALDNVQVGMEPTDLLARRTALFGMSRTGKSNTIKTIAASIFKLRAYAHEKGRVGQLIFDVNGEYCNDNPQDSGCLRNIWRETGEDEDVVTYGFFAHPNDPGRRLIKINFFGDEPSAWDDAEKVNSALMMMIAGKDIINEHLSGNTAEYVKSFVTTSMSVPVGDWGRSAQTRHRRRVAVYRAFLARAGFTPPAQLESAKVGKLFGNDLREAMTRSADNDEHKRERFEWAAEVLGRDSTSWEDLHGALLTLSEFMGIGQPKAASASYMQFNRRRGHRWDDDALSGLLSLLKRNEGIARLRGVRDRHSHDVSDDYSDKIVEELVAGKLVIVDQSAGAPLEIKHTAERIMWKIFEQQKSIFTNPRKGEDDQLLRNEDGDIEPPPDIIVYVEEAHNLLPAKSADLGSVWARVAKEGSKFRIGLVFSTQEPSSILSNILKNTDNWFVAHLNNQDETRELKKYYDFEMFVEQILKVPDTGFLRMRCLSNPYIVPVQVNKFEAPAGDKNSGQAG